MRPKPKDYPKLINVLGTDYRVCFARKLNDGDMGYCDGEMKLIVLSRDQTPDEMLETWLHEVLHAFEFESGMKLGHPRIDKLERVIADAIRSIAVAQGSRTRKPRLQK